MKKQPEITDRTRQAFVDAFIQIYMMKDINKITVREIVDLTGTSRATFYRYFQDVYAVFEYIEEFVYEQIGEELLESIKHNDAEENFVNKLSFIYQEWHLYLKVLFKEGGLDHFQKKIKAAGKERILENMILNKDNVRISYILDYYMTAVLTVLVRWVNHPEELSHEEMRSLLRGILSEGVIQQIRKENK